MKFDAEVAVVGAGVIGLAVAAELTRSGRSVLLLERHRGPGLEQSTHNSGVVHSGAFVRPGTLRARFCVEGNALLHERAREGGFRLLSTGTLVVADSAGQLARLEEHASWARQNGVPAAKRLDPAEVREWEPGLGPVLAGLRLPTGARIDADGLVRVLARETADGGGEQRFGWSLARARWDDGTWELTSSGGEQVRTRGVVNAAGVASGRIAEMLGAGAHPIYPCLGEYARVTGSRRDAVRSMVYGIPPAGYPGIGVHLTRTVDDELLVGPTASYLDSSQPPSTPQTSLEEFARMGRTLLPGLRSDELAGWPPGIRAKRARPGSAEAFEDFLVEELPPGRHAVQLVGVESPGLTASLALARYVSALPAFSP